MTITKISCAVWTAWIALCLAANAQTPESIEAKRANVVKLHTHFSTNKKDETAAGLLVGKDQQYAYFITARHAVVDEVGNQEVRPQSTEVWFYGAPQSVPAMVFDRTDGILDLGVVFVPVANLPVNIHELMKKDAAVSVPIVVIGHPAAGDWSVWQGTILNENAPNGDVHHFITTSNSSLAHGDSGGPVLDSEGNFVGMHTDTTASYGTSAKSGDILVQLRAWHVPTNNFLESPPVPDSEAVKQVLQLYEAAYNSRDAQALWKIWPNPPGNIKHSIETSFDNAVSIQMHLRPSQFQFAPDGNTGTVKGRLSQSYSPRKGSPQPMRDDDFTFFLKKNNGAWNIVDLR
jgi:hypothetical protein